MSEQDILEFEKQHKIRLPEDYRRFLLTSNGGILVDWTYVEYEDEEFDEIIPIRIEEFFGLGTKKNGSCVKSVKSDKL